MKLFLPAILFFFSNAALAYTETTLMCMESGQTAPVILAKYYEATSASEQSYVITTKYFADNTTESEELRGTEPDLTFTKATTEEGEEFLLINSIQATETEIAIRVLSCVAQ